MHMMMARVKSGAARRSRTSRRAPHRPDFRLPARMVAVGPGGDRKTKRRMMPLGLTLLAVAIAVTGSAVALAGSAVASGAAPQSTTPALPSEAAIVRWTGAELPNNSQLSSVSCPSATWCMAVGVDRAGGQAMGSSVSATFNGVSWAFAPLAQPQDGVYLTGVSCDSSTACMAVGSIATQQGTVPYAESWNGTAWLSRPPALPTTEKEGAFSSIACPTSSICLAVGGYVNASRVDEPISEVWKSDAWTIVRTPTDHAASEQFSSVSCADASSCVGVGGAAVTMATGSTHPFAVLWNGTRWKSTRPMSDRTSGSDYFSSVSCVRSGKCLAVGDIGVDGLMEAWSGSSWQSLTPLAQPAAKVELLGVSCPSVSKCVTVGLSQTSTGTSGFVSDLKGLRQSVVTVLSAGTNPRGVSGVSCVAANSCAAVGYADGPTGPSALAGQFSF
jgi:hypothetical protein